MRLRGLSTLITLAIAAGGVAASAGAARAATIVIDNADGAGEGFNDATAFTPVGGNTATTLGAARLTVFQTAAALWGAKLASAVPIHVSATFDPMSCSSTEADLGAAGTVQLFQNFTNAPKANTWYSGALANALAGTDLDTSNPDIEAAFSSSLDTGACLGGETWYYGLDAKPPSGTLDLLTVVLHELGHGLGFQTFVDLSTGAKIQNFDDVFVTLLARVGATPSSLSSMSNAQRISSYTSGPNLVWLGPITDGAGDALLSAGLTNNDVQIYAPSTVQPGSTLSHYSTTLTPNELMEPFYTGADHDLTLTADLLRDLGWSLAPPPPPVPAMPIAARAGLALAVLAAGAIRATRAATRSRAAG